MSVFSQWRSRDRPFSFPCIRTGGNISLQMDAAFFVPAVVGMAVLQAFYGEVVSCFTSTFFPPALLPVMFRSLPLSMARVSLAVTVLPVWVIISSSIFPLDFPALMPTFWSPPIPKEAVIPAPLLLLFPSVVFLFPWRCCLFCRCFCPM